MSTPILLTKLSIPQSRPALVHRPRLIEQLNNGLQRKLTLVSAPAGFGKTTAVTDWLQTQGDKRLSPFYIAWFSLDEGDNDPVQFLIYLIAALVQAEAIDAKFGHGLQNMLQSPQPLPMDSILISLINEISSGLDQIIIIFDDYHQIQAQPIHNILTFLLENLPTLAHLVITTREDPNLPIARLRAKNQLSDIRAIDLLFSHEETGEFLNQVMGLSLSAEDITMLETRTEGWIAGLQLAAISIQGLDDATSFIQTFSGSDRLVLDYLIEEVINQQPEDIQNFLLQTAILDRLTGSLCNAVTGQSNGQAVLEMLDRTNLFVIGLDSERKWYRYHHLFADLLNRLLRQTQLDSLPKLHIRASNWFKQQGANREAIKHSLEAKDFEKACKLVEAIAIDFLQQGEHTSVAGWIDKLPEELVNCQPYLSVLHAWALVPSGKIESAESRLLDAEKSLEMLDDKDDQHSNIISQGLIHTNRAYLSFMKGELGQTISYARRALKELPERASLFRVQTGIYLGVAYRYRGQLQAAFDTYNEILPITQQIGGKIAVQARQNMGDLQWQMAKLKQAWDVLEEALQITEQYAGRPDMPYSGYIYMLLGRILLQRGELKDAYQYFKKGFALCREWNLPEDLGLSFLELANFHWAMGNHDQARESYQEAVQNLDRISLWITKYAAAYQAKFEIAMGNISAAERWAQANDLRIDSDFEFHREKEYLALVRLLIVQRKFEEANALAERIFFMGQETGNKLAELESLVLLSLIIYGQGDVELALDNLQKALTIAKPEGFIRIFVDEGPPMARLLYEALSWGIETNYVQKLLAAFPETEPEKAAKKQKLISDGEWIEPLSDRELEVLQLIAEGLSRQEIASQLVLSLNTVKTHARNIFSKLGVNNQMQAVGKARGLGLLEVD